MRIVLLSMLALALAGCDGMGAPGDTPSTIETQAVMGFIPPDTAYRGMFVARAGYMCGLVLIEAGEFAEDAHIRFNSSPTEPSFQAAGGIEASCSPNRMTVIDLVTGQGHEADAPASLAEAEDFTRSYIDALLL